MTPPDTPPITKELILDPKDAEACAALMRQLPIHTEQDDPDLAAAFKEIDEFLESMESPDAEDEKDERN